MPARILILKYEKFDKIVKPSVFKEIQKTDEIFEKAPKFIKELKNMKEVELKNLLDEISDS